MPNTLRIKRRASGAAGAPASLANAELAYNEVDDVLYYGKGTGGSGGSATTVEAIGGRGAVVALTGNQTVAGTKTFSASPVVPTPTAAGHAVTKAYADALQTATTLTGDVTGSGTGNVATTLANFGTAGTYYRVTTDAKGRVQSGVTALAASDIPTLTAAKISDFNTAVRVSRLNEMAVPNAALNINSQRLTAVATPTAATDAATKGYVDGALQGLAPKAPARAATTGNITLSGTQTVDGVALAVGDRVLVKNQTTASQNGIYVVASGAWTRAADADAWTELINAYLFVSQGTTQADVGFVCTVDAGGTLGTTAVAFTEFSRAADVTAGAGLVRSGNALALTGQALALHNLGTNGLVARTASGAFAARQIVVSGAGLTVGGADGVAGNPTFTLHARLRDLASAAAPTGGILLGNVPFVDEGGELAFITTSFFMRSFLSESSPMAAQAALGIPDMTFDGGTF